MSRNEFVQMAGCANGYVINKNGVAKYPNGRVIKILDGKVTVKLVNGNHRAVKVSELLERNFGGNAADSEAVNAVESTKITEVVAEVTQEHKISPVGDLRYFSFDQLEAEIKRRKLQFIDDVVETLNEATADYGSEIVVAAVNKFMGD